MKQQSNSPWLLGKCSDANMVHLWAFFSVVFFRQRVYSNNPQISEQLQPNTERTVTNSDPETVSKAIQSAKKKAYVCAWEAGGHFQHFL